MNELESLAMDFHCLQELDVQDLYETFEPFMKERSYDGLHVRRNASFAHGCALLYGSMKARPFQQSVVPCTYAGFNSSEHAGCRLRHREGGDWRHICVITAHIVCDYTKGFQKLWQVLALLVEAKSQKDHEPHMPKFLYEIRDRVLGDDMNMSPDCLTMDMLTQGLEET
ncbi:hypothetical protein BGX28_004966 [Mortierella sp. GBA30]|nr:hypothetical protein BGX28_004966 [Mortierella sp. GBA30]